MNSNILSPRFLFKTTILLVVLGILAVIFVYRYHQLKTRVNITAFFSNASYILTTVSTGHMMERSSPVPDSLKKQTGNLLPSFRSIFPKMPEKYLRDPFIPIAKANPLLDVRFGTTAHLIPIHIPVYDPKKPAWFTFSAGPSEKSPKIQSIYPDSGYPHYRFENFPFDSTNGLWSQGYLYMDFKGGIFGEVR